MLILQMRHHIIGPFLFRSEQVEHFGPVRERLASHLDYLVVTDIPMVC